MLRHNRFWAVACWSLQFCIMSPSSYHCDSADEDKLPFFLIRGRCKAPIYKFNSDVGLPVPGDSNHLGDIGTLSYLSPTFESGRPSLTDDHWSFSVDQKDILAFCSVRDGWLIIEAFESCDVCWNWKYQLVPYDNLRRNGVAKNFSSWDVTGLAMN